MANYTRTTLAELDARLLERVGGEGVFWEGRERLRAINEALDVWQMLTGDYIKTVTATAVSTTDVVAIATTNNVALPLRVTPAAGGAALTDANIHDYDTGEYGWRNVATGTPDTWLPTGVGQFIVTPKPTTDTNLTLLCIADDYRLSSGDTVNLGDEELVRILDYAQWYLSFKEGPEEGGKNSSPLRALFILAANKRNTRLKRTALYRKFMGNQPGELSPTRETPESMGYR